VRTWASTVLPASRSLAASQLAERGRRIVEKDAVSVFAMFAQSFSVISHHNNHCSLIPSLFLEVSQELTQRESA